MNNIIYTLIVSCIGLSGTLQASSDEIYEDAIGRLVEQALSQGGNNIDLIYDLASNKVDPSLIREMMGLKDQYQDPQHASKIEGDIDLAHELFSQENAGNDFYLTQQLLKEQEEAQNLSFAQELFLQEQEETQNFSLAQKFLQEEEDRLLAQQKTDRLLAQLSQPDVNPSPLNAGHKAEPLTTPKITVPNSVLNILTTAQKESYSYQNANVHVFNKSFVVKYRNLLYSQLINSIGLKTNTPISEVINSIQPHASGSLNASIAKMQTHNLSAVDGETGLRIDQVLSCVVDLCEKLKSLPHHRINAYPYLIESLKENIDTNGGCKPGYAGRCFRDFLYLSAQYLDNVHVIPSNQ